MNSFKKLYYRARYVADKKKKANLPLMQNTIRIPHKNGTKIIAHRGVSGLQTENTVAAFIEAGKRSYYGIETDVHRTKDGKFVVFHDDTLQFMAKRDLVVEQTDFDTLRQIPLLACRVRQYSAPETPPAFIPTLREYIDVCKQYDKQAILELKNHFEAEDIRKICDEIEDAGWLARTVFISFDFENLVFVRDLHPAQPVQFLTGLVEDFDALFERLQQYKFDWDGNHLSVPKKFVDKCHAAGIRVNVWTVDDLAAAKRMIKAGVDFITTDILE